jgi:hypothetical protein
VGEDGEEEVLVWRIDADEDETALVATTALSSKTRVESLLPTDEEIDVSLYMSSLFPAPQYSY